jgi:dUTPase
MQGIFINYLLTDDDSEDDKQVRNGGFGSTDQNEV